MLLNVSPLSLHAHRTVISLFLVPGGRPFPCHSPERTPLWSGRSPQAPFIVSRSLAASLSGRYTCLSLHRLQSPTLSLPSLYSLLGLVVSKTVHGCVHLIYPLATTEKKCDVTWDNVTSARQRHDMFMSLIRKWHYAYDVDILHCYWWVLQCYRTWKCSKLNIIIIRLIQEITFAPIYFMDLTRHID